jgi:phage gp29-like protein
MLDRFHLGDLAQAAQAWESIERRDDVLQGVVSKRKKAVARLGFEVLTLEDSIEAIQHKEALEYFYNNLTATHACDANEQGGFSLLVKQMMDAVGKRYSVHELVFEPREQGKRLTATFRHVPLWFFENKTGRLRFLKSEGDTEGIELERGAWMVSTGEGLMEASSIAYLFKHLPLRDWLVYCERNGMPGVKGVTDAAPGSLEWEFARKAVEDFGAEFNALMSQGSDIQAIDLTAGGTLPYPALIERMDRALIALWRGSDLSTLSSSGGVGASVQQSETDLLEDDDALRISETLNAHIDRLVLKSLFGVDRGKAYVRLKVRDRRDRQSDIELFQKLFHMGVPLSLADVRERFGLTTPDAGEALLTLKQ